MLGLIKNIIRNEIFGLFFCLVRSLSLYFLFYCININNDMGSYHNIAPKIVRAIPHCKYSTFTLEFLLITLLFLGSVAFYTLLERKGIAAVQRREGPNVTGPLGLLQPVVDGMKLIFKDNDPSDEADAEIFDLAPIVTFSISFTG